MNFVKPLLYGVLLIAATLLLGEEPAYRTDSGSNDKLPWFQLKAGEFPPEGSAHAISGELIGVDHVNRKGVLRPDRNDSQRTDDYDIAMPFSMLPYGSLSYHGAPAELRHLPLGTHLHGQFYFEEKAGKDNKGTFTKALRLEDDFSFFARQQRWWKVEAVDLNKKALTVTGAGEKQTDAQPTVFQINDTTRVWKGRAMGVSADLAAGQLVLLNLTVCTLKGSGRCTDIWLDAESRELATSQQLAVHRQFQREHGLAGWIEEVDNAQGIVTAALFAGFDPRLLEDFTTKDSIAAACATDTLRTYDQINDTARGEILEVQSVPVVPGHSGKRLKFKPGIMLEGFRPQRFTRLFSGKWPVDDLPKEEAAYP